MAEIDPDLGRLLMRHRAEGYDYYLACEDAPPPGFTLSAMTVTDGDRVIAMAPAFRIVFHIGMNMTGRSRTVRDWLAGKLPQTGKVFHLHRLVHAGAVDLHDLGQVRRTAAAVQPFEHAARRSALAGEEAVSQRRQAVGGENFQRH